eukprot:356915-Chlamydomonas_euryale.AAC.2
MPESPPPLNASAAASADADADGALPSPTSSAVLQLSALDLTGATIHESEYGVLSSRHGLRADARADARPTTPARSAVAAPPRCGHACMAARGARTGKEQTGP